MVVVSNIRLKNLTFSYGEREVFKGINFYLPKGKTLSIIGPGGSGKTTFLKLLNNELEYDGNIIISGIDVNKNNFGILKNYISVVYQDSLFLNEIVIDELRYSLENKNVSPVEISAIIKELDGYFGINKILNKDIFTLSLNDRTLVKILSYAVTMPSYLAIDDLLIDLDVRTKILLLNYLNSKNILLINVTSNSDDALYTDYTICLYDGIIAIDGKSIDVFKEEKLLKRIGLSLPFMIDLSIQLQLYGLIGKCYLSKEKMVKQLWK